MEPFDLLGAEITKGDVVAHAVREQNVANLRIGVVTETGVDFEPNVTKQSDTPRVPVVWVRWDTTTGGYLPLRPTKVAARKVVVISD